MKVSIIIPVIRPKNIPKLVNAILQNAGVKESEYEIITKTDTKRIGAPKMVKRLVEKAKYDLIMFIGDDVIPQRNFLKNALKAMKQFTDLDGLIGLNDTNRRADEAPTHWLASKKLLPALDGEFFHTGYIHQYCDNELALRCMAINKYLFAPDAIIEHNHPGFKGKEKSFMENIAKNKDKFYKETYSKKVHDHDIKLFKQRTKKLNMIYSTGERVVIGDMKNEIVTLQEHIARYNFAMKYCSMKKVLDAACSTGYGTNLLAEAAVTADGWDISKKTIDFASNKYNHTFKVMDLTKKLPDIKYDTIVSFETIEHMKDPNNFLRWVVDHCDTFVFSVPLNNPSQFHLAVYTLEDLEKMIGKYWTDVEWLSQEWIHIIQGVNQGSTFAIGICNSSNIKRLTKKKN